MDKPELLKCLHVEPYNLAFGRPCRQMTIYNEQGPHLAVNGDIGGTLATCIHTHVLTAVLSLRSIEAKLRPVLFCSWKINHGGK